MKQQATVTGHVAGAQRGAGEAGEHRPSSPRSTERQADGEQDSGRAGDTVAVELTPYDLYERQNPRPD